ncbi:chemotaxis protein CheX [Candidatus Desantisbacteria bacterium]|nr:chemotaxis protein CheX [Candidatus Desantisbacteria bacterium]
MKTEFENTIHKIVVKIFEEAGYIFIDEESIEKYKDTCPEATMSVDFKGIFCGRLILSVYGGNFLSTLAANMLGEEINSSEDQKIDALGEIVNLICGNLLPEIADTKEIFYIDPPKKIINNEDIADSKKIIAEMDIGFENGFVKTKLYVEKNNKLFF